MSDGQKDQPQQPKSGNGWLIAFGALFAGYLLGQNSTPSSQPAYADPSPPPLVRTTDTETADAQPAEDIALQAAIDALDQTGEATAEATTETEYQPAYAYAPASTYPTYTPPESEGDASEFQVASTSDVTEDSTLKELTAGAATAVATSTEPWARYQPTTAIPTTTYRAPPAVSYSGSSSKCEGLGCYGVISDVTGLPRTTYVRAYTRKDGTYVQPHYRSRRR